MLMLLRRLSERAYAKDGVIRKWRSSRMRAFIDLVRPPKGARILDLGGTPHNWGLIEHDFDVTLLNLPDDCAAGPQIMPPGITNLVGDATDLAKTFADQSFDVVFSNSVIEHVGGPEKRKAMAAEVHRLAPAHWIQTPSDRFPVEIHTGVPYFFRLPGGVRAHLLNRWERKLPAWTQMIRGTTVVSRGEMQQMFPTSQIFVEDKFGLEKSYAFYRPWITS